MASDYDCTLEGLPGPPAVRLGLRMVDRLKKESAERIVAARAEQPFDDADDLARRASLEGHEMSLLAAANALTSLSGHRRQQVWDASALKSAPPLLRAAPIVEDMVELAAAPEGEEIVWDCAALGLTLRRHPLALLRASLARRGLATAAELRDLPDGCKVKYCGIVTLRQQPQTAHGTVFVSLEDETGTVQVICWKSIREKQRQFLLESRQLVVFGRWQCEGDVRNLVAERLGELTPLLGRLGKSAWSRDFR